MRQILALWVFDFRIPPPPQKNWNLGRSWHFEYLTSEYPPPTVAGGSFRMWYILVVYVAHLLLLLANKVCEGYVFTCVCHSVHRGGLPQCMLGYHPTPKQTPPRSRHPPRSWPLPRSRHPPPMQCMLGDTVNKRLVCILLEFNLVFLIACGIISLAWSVL